MFDKESLSESELKRLRTISHYARGDILKMTTLAKSGHPGGSMSSLDIYVVLFSYAKLDEAPRDRIVISHGHTSPGVYAALARVGYLPIDEVIAFFRKGGSPYEGHVVKGIPFIDWSTGNLGQGLSAACGFAIASKLKNEKTNVFVVMSDGEQQKGQVSEARRFAVKYQLSNILVIIDYNRIQICGPIEKVMPQNIIENYLSDGWDVIQVDGHDYLEIYSAIRRALQVENPVCIVANTVMGKGVPFMENNEKYHGSPLTEEEYKKAMEILGLDDDLEKYKEMRKGIWSYNLKEEKNNFSLIQVGKPFTYEESEKVDSRTAFGRALKDIADKNIPQGRYICVFDCDLAPSVKTVEFSKAYPQFFFQSGIQEHNTATVAGALSTTGIVTFFADFGVFGLDETYNQHRLNDINKTNLKLILTHVGLDVGQDGKTHQCIDYIGLARNLFYFKLIVPCDPNQTDRVIRYVAKTEGNFIVAMGRSRWPVIYGSDGHPFYGEDYEFVYGRADVIREGKDVLIVTYGGMVHRALAIREELLKEGISTTVVNMASVFEIDRQTLRRFLSSPVVVTYEDHNVYTGIAPSLSRFLLEEKFTGRFLSFGVKKYGVSGDTEEALKAESLDIATVSEKIKEAIKKL
ncbi:MAG: transketolase [Deltaproteobacteria bacterium]|nr:transketolase [Deltaproteobacteria bacterium]